MRKIVFFTALLFLLTASFCAEQSPFSELINQSMQKFTLLNGTRLNETALSELNSQLNNSTVLEPVFTAFNNTKINLQLQYNKSSILEISIFFLDREIKDIYFGIDSNAGKNNSILIKLDIFKIERLASDWISYVEKENSASLRESSLRCQPSLLYGKCSSQETYR